MHDEVVALVEVVCAFAVFASALVAAIVIVAQ